MASGNFFNGSFTRHPRVSAFVDDFGLAPLTGGPENIVAILGVSTGGQPKTPILLSDPSQAARVFNSGELLIAINRAFSPSTEVNGASLILGVRVNPATQATLTLKDDDDADVIDVTSSDWGQKESQKKIKIENGSINGKKISLGFQGGITSHDNLYRALFSIKYTGTGTLATLTITATHLTTAVTGGDPGDTLNIDLAVYDTVQKLFDLLDANTAYDVVMLGLNIDAPTPNGLDFVTAEDIKTVAYTVTDTLGACLEYLNSPDMQPYVRAVLATGAGTPPANIPWTYMTGGAEGAVVTQDWQDAFDAIQRNQANFVVPVTGDAAVHEMGDEHCVFVSKDGKTPRRQFVGAAMGEYTQTLENYLVRAQDLNADRTALIAQGIRDYNDEGKLVVIPPYIVAAQMAGMQAGVPEIGTPITMKSIRAAGLEWLPTLAEDEIAIDGGILMLELAANRGFYRVVRGITTWLKNDKFNRVEISTGIAVDEVVRQVVTNLEIFLGEKANKNIANRILSRTQSTLDDLVRQGIIVAWHDIIVNISGDTAYVEFACSPVLPLNFINVTIHAEIFSGTVTSVSTSQ